MLYSISLTVIVYQDIYKIKTSDCHIEKRKDLKQAKIAIRPLRILWSLFFVM